MKISSKRSLYSPSDGSGGHLWFGPERAAASLRAGLAVGLREWRLRPRWRRRRLGEARAGPWALALKNPMRGPH